GRQSSCHQTQTDRKRPRPPKKRTPKSHNGQRRQTDSAPCQNQQIQACSPYLRRPSTRHWQGVQTDHQQPSSRCRLTLTPSTKKAPADPATSPGETSVCQGPRTLEHLTFEVAGVY
ncbi:hypothetical protein BaRGS_00009590, partial [Batillaria attramentaria]